jgi:hypothetical protein
MAADPIALTTRAAIGLLGAGELSRPYTAVSRGMRWSQNDMSTYGIRHKHGAWDLLPQSFFELVDS